MLDRLKETEFYQELATVMKTNSTMLTGFAAVLIMVSGVAVVDHTERWWVPVVSLTVFSLVVFLFMNFRVIIKAIGSTVVTVMLSSFAFTGGSLADRFGLGGLVWVGMIWALFFGTLAWSYGFQSGRSRWAPIMLAQFVSFSAAYTLILGSLPVAWSALAGAVLGFVTFIVGYTVFGRTRFRAKSTPVNFLDDELAATFVEGAENLGWEATPMPGKGDTGSVLVWNDERAYLLHPIKMTTPFGTIGKRSQSLSYRRKSITPWLNHLIYHRIPLWRSRGADITLVLVDLNRRNSESMKVIAQPVPDSNRFVPVCVAPISRKRSPQKVERMLKDVDSTMEPMKRDLTGKQLKALAGIGVEDAPTDEVSDAAEEAAVVTSTANSEGDTDSIEES